MAVAVDVVVDMGTSRDRSYARSKYADVALTCKAAVCRLRILQVDDEDGEDEVVQDVRGRALAERDEPELPASRVLFIQEIDSVVARM